MKICIVSFNIFKLFSPNCNARMGGAELDLFTLARGLRNYFETTVITGDWGQNNVEFIDGIKIFKSYSQNKSVFSYIKAPIVLWNALYNTDSDVYISSSAGPEVGLISIFCKLFKKKYIYRTAHDIDCNGTYVKQNGIAGSLFELGLLSAFKIVISVNKHKDLLLERYTKMSENMIVHIPLGIEIPNINNDLSDKTYILWIARGTKWKRPEIFLNIANNFPKEKFVMIMPIQETEKRLYKKITGLAQSTKNVTFIGGVSFIDTQKYFDHAKLFINTSDNEGFTYTLIQSGIAHTPVAYLNVNPDNVITSFNIGEFGGGSVENLIKDINFLLKNDSLWKEKSNAIHNYVIANHDINNLSKKWIKLIDSLL